MAAATAERVRENVMRLKRPYVASLDQVRITREPDGAVIFVPDDETHLDPRIEVREPREDER